MSFTTPEANMSLKSSQRISQKVTPSCSLTLRDPLINVSGATRIQRNPVSRSRLSLDGIKVVSVTRNSREGEQKKEIED